MRIPIDTRSIYIKCTYSETSLQRTLREPPFFRWRRGFRSSEGHFSPLHFMFKFFYGYLPFISPYTPTFKLWRSRDFNFLSRYSTLIFFKKLGNKKKPLSAFRGKLKWGGPTWEKGFCPLIRGSPVKEVLGLEAKSHKTFDNADALKDSDSESIINRKNRAFLKEKKKN